MGIDKKPKPKKQKESGLRSAVLQALKPLHVVPVENPLACPGTPDVNYGGKTKWDPKTGVWEDWRSVLALEGWIELKRAKMPARPVTQRLAVKVRPEQPPWWNLRQRAGGKVNVLLEIDAPTGRGRGRCFWFDGIKAGEVLGRSRLDVLETSALSLWKPEDGPFEFWLRMQLMR